MSKPMISTLTIHPSWRRLKSSKKGVHCARGISCVNIGEPPWLLLLCGDSLKPPLYLSLRLDADHAVDFAAVFQNDQHRYALRPKTGCGLRIFIHVHLGDANASRPFLG